MRAGIASYSASLSGWAAGAGSWDSVACPQHAAQGFQWLSFEGNRSRGSAAGLFEAAPGGAVRVLRSGTVSGAVRVHWQGRSTSWSKYLIVGQSTLESGRLPSPHDTCLLPASACGACIDGFTFADCGCDTGAVDVTFSHVVEAGQLLQVAAIPAQFEGTHALAGEFFASFTPGGFCDFTSAVAADGCASPWDGVWLGGDGCTVESARQSLDAKDHALSLATKGCMLTEAINSSPFLYRTVVDGRDFVATVQVRDSSNVQWSGGGLLLTPPSDGATEWVALRVVQARTVVLEAARSGYLEEAQLASTAGAPEPWLQLERRAGALHVRWRAVEGRPWEELAGSPLTHAELRGAVRVGLTHQTFSRNVGATTLAAFVLEASSAAHSADGDASGDAAGDAAGDGSDDEQPTLANEVAWTQDECMGAALALDEVDDHVLLPRATLCAADALHAAPAASPAALVSSATSASSTASAASASAASAAMTAVSTASAAEAVALRIWWRTSELEGQWYLPGRFGEFEEWLFAHGMPGAAGSLNVYLLEGSGILRTRVCGGGATGGAAGEAKLAVSDVGSDVEEEAAAVAVAVAERSACLGHALDVRPEAATRSRTFADDAWHFYLLALRCADKGKSSCTASVYVDGELQIEAVPVGAPLSAASRAGAGRPAVGARSDLDPLRFFGGLLGRVSLRAGDAPTQEVVRDEWAAFWRGSPCVEGAPPEREGAIWLMWLWLLLLLALLGGAPAVAAVAVPRFRRHLRARALALFGEVPLLGLHRPPPSQSTEHIQSGSGTGRWLVRPGPGSSGYSQKLSNMSCEIICNGSGGGGPSSPTSSLEGRRVLSPRAGPPVPLLVRGGTSGGRSFQASSSSRKVTIRAEDEAPPMTPPMTPLMAPPMAQAARVPHAAASALSDAD